MVFLLQLNQLKAKDCYFCQNFKRLKFIKTHIESIIAALMGFFIIILLTKHGGVGISPDSIHYLSTSDYIIQGKGFYQFDGAPLVLFPFFYPIFLAFVKILTPGNFLDYAAYVNAFLFSLTLLFSGIILSQSNIKKGWKYIILAIIFLSPCLLETYTMLWSETLFITELLAFFLISKVYFEKFALKYLLLMASLAAIIVETRFAGVTIIATGTILILFNKTNGNKSRWVHSITFILIASSLFILNLIRNYNLSNSLSGIRQKGVTPFSENLKFVGKVINDWLPFSNATQGLCLVIGCLFIFILIIRCIVSLAKLSIIGIHEKTAIVFTFVYTMFMLFIATISRFESINNRLLSPIFIPFLFIFCMYFSNLFKRVKHGFKSIGTIVLMVIGMATLFQYCKIDYGTYKENNEGGIGGYSDDDWRVNSGILNFLKANPVFFDQQTTLYSNAAHAVYLYTQKEVQILPERKHISLVNKFNKTPTLTLIWFNNEDNPEILTLNELQSVKNLQIIHKFNDGIIYQCTLK
jgi:hypothetical protein